MSDRYLSQINESSRTADPKSESEEAEGYNSTGKLVSSMNDPRAGQLHTNTAPPASAEKEPASPGSSFREGPVIQKADIPQAKGSSAPPGSTCGAPNREDPLIQKAVVPEAKGSSAPPDSTCGAPNREAPLIQKAVVPEAKGSSAPPDSTCGAPNREAPLIQKAVVPEAKGSSVSPVDSGYCPRSLQAGPPSKAGEALTKQVHTTAPDRPPAPPSATAPPVVPPLTKLKAQHLHVRVEQPGDANGDEWKASRTHLLQVCGKSFRLAEVEVNKRFRVNVSFSQHPRAALEDMGVAYDGRDELLGWRFTLTVDGDDHPADTITLLNMNNGSYIFEGYRRGKKSDGTRLIQTFMFKEPTTTEVESPSGNITVRGAGKLFVTAQVVYVSETLRGVREGVGKVTTNANPLKVSSDSADRPSAVSCAGQEIEAAKTTSVRVTRLGKRAVYEVRYVTAEALEPEVHRLVKETQEAQGITVASSSKRQRSGDNGM